MPGSFSNVCMKCFIFGCDGCSLLKYRRPVRNYLPWKHTNYFISRLLGHFHIWLGCFRTWCVFSISSVRLGICEHGNCAWIRTKIIGLRLHEQTRWSQPDSKRTLEWWEIIRPNWPTNLAVSQYMTGNYILLMPLKMNHGLSWSKDKVKCLIEIWLDKNL